MPIISLWTFLDWLFYGLIRYILWWVPVVQPFRVDRTIPGHWWMYNTYYDWYEHLDGDKRPDEHWIQQWLEMTFGEFKRLVASAAEDLARGIRDYLLALIGYVRSGFPSLGAWIDAIGSLVGDSLPFFASTLSGGLAFLYSLLPVGIRNEYKTWGELFDGIRDAAVSIARGLVDAVRHLAEDAHRWVFDQGQRVYDFYGDVQHFVRDLVRDPRGTITGVLGDTWAFLVMFALSPVSIVLSWLGPDWTAWLTFNAGPAAFLYNLWSTYHDEIADLFEDPRGWVMDRLESAIMDRW